MVLKYIVTSHVGTFAIQGPDVYKYLKYESGVHKVQRVPLTEKYGRVHSSTAQVAILGETSFSTLR